MPKYNETCHVGVPVTSPFHWQFVLRCSGRVSAADVACCGLGDVSSVFDLWWQICALPVAGGYVGNPGQHRGLLMYGSRPQPSGPILCRL